MNLISLYGTIKANGTFVTEFPQDITPAMIAWVAPVTIENEAGVSTPCFWIRVEAENQLSAQDYYLAVTTDLADLDEFLGALTALSASNTFTKYTTLKYSSDIAAGLITSTIDVLINDAFTQKRYYSATPNETAVYVKLKNRLLNTKFVFDGDQTIAGGGYYLTYTS